MGKNSAVMRNFSLRRKNNPRAVLFRAVGMRDAKNLRKGDSLKIESNFGFGCLVFRFGTL